MRGKLITLEGIDGAGKSTHVGTIETWLNSQRIMPVTTREPGGTPLAETLRQMVLTQPMSALAETLLMFAARHDHYEQRIAPALARGEWVLTDRFVDASYAYQGGGRGVADEYLHELERWVVGDTEPDLTFWFDLEPALAHQRLLQGRGTDLGDRFEQEEREFFIRVQAGYQRRFSHRPARLWRIDAAQSPEQVKDQVLQGLKTKYEEWGL